MRGVMRLLRRLLRSRIVLVERRGVLLHSVRVRAPLVLLLDKQLAVVLPLRARQAAARREAVGYAVAADVVALCARRGVNLRDTSRTASANALRISSRAMKSRIQANPAQQLSASQRTPGVPNVSSRSERSASSETSGGKSRTHRLARAASPCQSP